MARRTKTKRGPSQRQLRVGELLRHILSDAFMRDGLRDPALVGVSITVTEVRVSPDLQVATIFCMPLGGDNPAGVIEALNKARSFLRGVVGQNVDLRYTPQLKFMLDQSFDEAKHIDELLRSDAVSRDLSEPSTETDE
jgi:ribosome-binding factor A